MTTQSDKTFIINLPLEQTIELAKLALWKIGANIFPVTPEPGVVLGRTGASFRSWGEELQVSITSATTGCSVQVHSESSWKTTLIDWGKNVDNVTRFEQELLSLAKRA